MHSKVDRLLGSRVLCYCSRVVLCCVFVVVVIVIVVGAAAGSGASAQLSSKSDVSK